MNYRPPPNRMLGLFLLVLQADWSNAIFGLPEVRDAKIGEFPWMALLMHGREYKNGATIISRYYVLTVCKRRSFFSDLPKREYLYSNYRIMGGTVSKNFYDFQGAQVKWIYYWENHPKCRLGGDTGFASFDVSIIKVRTQFIFNELLHPMPFMRDQKKMQGLVEGWIEGGNASCTFGGWGAHKFHKIVYIPMEGPEYTPDQPENPLPDGTHCTECFPSRMKVLRMTLIPDDLCRTISETNVFKASVIYRRYDPVDTMCGVGVGENGNKFLMGREGMPCSRDNGNALVCDGPEGPMVVGHFSYSNLCNIEWVDFPTVFTRFDRDLHDWVMQFYSTTMYGKHWVAPIYPKAFDYCQKYHYSGPIDPDL